MKLKTIVAAVAIATSACYASDHISNVDKIRSNDIFNVRTNASYSQNVLNSRHATSIALDILKSRKSGNLSSNSIYISGKGEIYGSYGNINGSSNGNNISTTNVKMPHIAFTSTIGEWVTGFADVQVTNSGSKNINFPNVYFTVGNLLRSPFYLVGGKKVVDFGAFYSPNNFSPTLTRTYFMVYGGQIAGGFTHNGMNATFTLVNGFGQSMLNSNASKAHQLNDFALSVSYSSKSGNLAYHSGAGYINATGFNRSASFNSQRVGAIDFNLGMTTAQGLSVNGEFLMTTRGVKATNNSSVYKKHINAKNTVSTTSVASSTGYTALGFNTLPRLIDFTSGATVKAWSFDTSYRIPVSGKEMIPYFSYSHVAQNSKNNIYQIEIGTRYNVIDTVWLGGSYNYITGKTSGSSIGKFNTLMLDLSAYF
jgi:hypothetical protein